MTLRDKLKFWLALNNYIEMIVRDTSLLSLPNAMEDSLDYLKALGGTEITPKVYFDSVTANGGCEQRNLPVEYTQIEYLESTGTQYIDTGYKSSNNTKVKAQISCPNFGTFIFGSRNNTTGDTQKRFGLFLNVRWNPQYANQNGSGSETMVNTIYKVEISQDGFYVNNSLNTSFVSETFSGDYNMYLFANNTADTTIGYGSCKIYSFEIYTNNVLEHKYIPCKNSSNVLGMYDTVSGTFLTNAGTGTFTAGPNAVPSPDNPMDIYCNNGALKVRHQSGLPLGYTLLDYIESTGTQYIDTGIKPNSNTAISIKYYPATSSVFMCLYGIQDSTSLNRFYGLISSTQFRIQINSNAGQTPNFWGINNDGTLITNTNGTFAQTQGIVTLGVDNKNKVISIKSDEYTGNISASDTVLGDNLDCQYNLLLLSRSTAGTAGNNFSGRLYSFTVKDNDMIIQNLIPAKRNSDNVVGMYDTVSGTFFTNAGTGDFVAGNVVNDLEPYVDLVPAGKNLFDSSMFNIEVGDTITYTYHQIPNGTYTMSTDFPPQTGQVYTNVWIMAGRQTSGQSSTTNGVSLGNPKTINVTDGWYTVAYRSSIPAIPQNPKDYNWQLEKGSTATDYEPYSAKRKVETIQITGKNLFDAQWKVGIYSPANGAFAPTTNRICNTSIIQVKPSTAYTISCPDYALAGGMRWLFYDANKNFISANTTGATTITTPSNAKYINFYIANNLTVATAPDLQIEQGSTSTAYESYFNGGSAVVENLFGLDTYKDTQEVLSGNVTRNVGIKVLDGTEDWTYNNSAFLMDLVDRLPQKHFMFCTHFNYDNGSSTVIPNLCIGGAGATNTIFIKYQTYNTAEQFKQFLAAQYTNGTPVIIVYPLATPTTESVSPQPLTYIDNYVLTIEDASISNPIVNATNSTHTVPTPDKPLDITCNNGVLKVNTETSGKNVIDISDVVQGYLSSTQGQPPTIITSTASYIIKNAIKVSNGKKYKFSYYSDIGGNRECNIVNSNGIVTLKITLICYAGLNEYIIESNADGYLWATVQLGDFAIVKPSVYEIGGTYADDTVETINVHGKNLLNDTNVVNAYNATGNYTYKGYFVTSISSYTNNPLYRMAHCVLPAGSYRFETDTANAYMLRYAIGSAVTELFSDNQKQYIDFTLTTTTEFSICWRNATSTEFTGEHSWISKGSTATPYEPYFDGGTATMEMLLKVGNYQDVQSIIDGAVTRNVGVKVLDGTEEWTASGFSYYVKVPELRGITSRVGLSTHFPCTNNASVNAGYFAFGGAGVTNGNILFGVGNDYTLADWKQWLADQYAAGTPVIVVYPLAEPTTESIAGQTLQVTEGNNIAEITQASLDNLELEAKYNNVP